MLELENLRKAYIDKIDAYFHNSILPEVHKTSGLKEILEYQYSTGGKRLRPLSTILSFHLCRSFTNKNKENLLREKEEIFLVAFATIVELLHTATLIHDDYQDGDQYRRNLPTAWKKFSPEQAINAGDLAFFLGIRCLQKENLPQEKELIEILQKNMCLLIEGQGAEMHMKQKWQKENILPSLEDYQNMALGKTAALFNLPMLGGAILAGAGEKEKELLKKATSLLGLSFQIRDDLIDLWGEKGRDTRASDIAEGKLSYPILKGFQKLSLEKEKSRDPINKLSEILKKERKETSPEELSWTLELLKELGVRDTCKEEYQKIEKEIASIPFWGEALAPFCSYLRSGPLE